MTTTEDRADSLGRDVLDARIATLEVSVAKQEGITRPQMDAQRPGGADNPDRSSAGALSYLCWLHRQHAQGPIQQMRDGSRWDARAMEDLRAALAAEPIQIRLDSGREVAVYPKGEHALNRIALGQLSAEWILVRKLALMEAEQTAETLRAIAQAIDAETHLSAEFVHIVTHSGPGVPWTQENAFDHAPPDWCLNDISPFDMVAIRKAHLECNVLRIHAIAERTKHLTTGGSDAMPLAAFLGVMASELNVQPAELARRWTLGEIFASSLAKWEATERAKAKAAASQPPKAGR